MVAKKTSPFSVQVVGYREHGAMIELFYDGGWGDLDKLDIDVSISQGGNIEETQVVQVLEGRHLAEMTEAMYNLGEVDIVLNVQRQGFSSTEITKVNLTAQYDQAHAFLYPVFHQSDVVEYIFHKSKPHTERFYAHDLWFGEGIEGLSVYMPFSLQIMRIREMTDVGGVPPYNYSMWIRHPFTGYHCCLQHTQPGELIRSLVGNGNPNDFGWGYPPTNAPYFSI